MHGSRSDNGKASPLHLSFTTVHFQNPPPLVRVDGFVFDPVILLAEPMPFPHKNDLTDIPGGMSKPKFPSPRLHNFLHFVASFPINQTDGHSPQSLAGNL